MINHITKLLYPTAAKLNATTLPRVERAIRHAIEVAWDRGGVDTLNAYFGYTIHNGRGKPTDSEFMAIYRRQTEDAAQTARAGAAGKSAREGVKPEFAAVLFTTVLRCDNIKRKGRRLPVQKRKKAGYIWASSDR